MTTTATTTFDVDALARAIEGRDAEAQIAMFTDDAVITTIDHEHPPSAPDVVSGREAIAAQLRDVCSRDMTHEVPDAVLAGDTLAYRIDCRYADGTRVACHATARLRDGRIAAQHGVQAWDH
jgi:ketosteroid isomerase-like protein